MLRKCITRGFVSLVLLLVVAQAHAATQMTVLVTGANRGIGLEFVKQLRERGFPVIGTARKPEQATELKALGAQVIQLDVTDAASISAMAAELEGQTIGMLINNAGMLGHTAASFAETDFEKIGTTFAVNSLGPMRVTQALLPNILAGSQKTVIHISSVMGSIASNRGGYYGYRASKAALNMFNSSLAIELKDEGVTTVVMHPGWVRTDLGGAGADIAVDVSVAGMLDVIGGLGPDDTGRFYDYQGKELPW